MVCYLIAETYTILNSLYLILFLKYYVFSFSLSCAFSLDFLFIIVLSKKSTREKD